MIVKKWLVVLFYFISIALIFLYKNRLLLWIREEPSDILPVFTAAVLLALVPIIPYSLIAGVIGAKFGVFLGGVINVAASTTAAMIMFLVVRFAFSLAGRIYLSKYPRIERFTALFEANPFFAVLFARLIPVIPAPAVNIYSGISGLPIAAFFLATVIGKIPVNLVFAFVGDQLF